MTGNPVPSARIENSPVRVRRRTMRCAKADTMPLRAAVFARAGGARPAFSAISRVGRIMAKPGRRGMAIAHW